MAAQVLPLAQSHFGSLSSYSVGMFPDYQAYQSLQDNDMNSYLSDPHAQQPFLVSPRALSSTTVQRRPSQSPHASMRQPPGRNRTPIQHHRVSSARARSHSRSELLFAYATDPTHVSPPPSHPSMTVIPSQSAPTTPQIFPLPPYSLQEGTGEAYTVSNDYFPAHMTPVTSAPGPDFSYQHATSQYQPYYPIGRSASHSAASGMSSLNPQENMYSTHPGPGPSQSFPNAGHHFTTVHAPLESTPGEMEIMSTRTKAQCWDHGCNGRQFSTFSNLLRHQREKSGGAMKAVCPYCGTEFTRTTARNGHMHGGKCKGRSEKDSSESSSTGGGKERE